MVKSQPIHDLVNENSAAAKIAATLPPSRPQPTDDDLWRQREKEKLARLRHKPISGFADNPAALAKSIRQAMSEEDLAAFRDALDGDDAPPVSSASRLAARAFGEPPGTDEGEDGADYIGPATDNWGQSSGAA